MSTLNRDVRFRFHAINELDSSETKLKQILDLIRQQNAQIRATTSAYTQQAAASARALGQIQQAQMGVQQAINQTTGAIRSNTQQVTGELGKVHGSISGVVSGLRDLRTIIGASLSLMAVKEFTVDVIEAKSQIDFFKVGLDQMLQSKRDVSILYPQIIQLAKTTPFQVKDLFDATLAMKAMGVQTNDLIPTITQLGNAAAVVGTDKLPLIAKAYTDVMNKGKLMKQEINQFAENGIPLYDLMADSMGKARSEVVKMAEDHVISFDHVREAFKVASEEGGRYHDMMILQSQTLAGKVSNLEDAFFVAKASIGDYYENGLRNGIQWTQEFVEATIGSQSAIQRTVNYIKAAATVITGLVVSLNAATLAMRAKAVATGTLSAVVGTYNYVTGLLTLAQIAAARSTDGFTQAQLRAAVAARATTAAIAASPLAPLVLLLTAVTAGYYAFQAATAEVVTTLGEQEIRIVQEQKNMNALAKTAMEAAMGTSERKTAILALMKDYPDYFRGLDAEKVSNSQLKAILDKVNVAYDERINLARQAYQVEKFANEQRELFKKEDEIFGKLSGKLPQRVLDEASGSLVKLNELLRAGQGGVQAGARMDWWNPFGTNVQSTVNEWVQQMNRVTREIEKHSMERTRLQENEVQLMIAAENRRWDEVKKGLKKGTDEYEIEHAAHTKRVSELNGKSQEADYTHFVNKQKQKVEKARISSREIEYIFDEHQDKKLSSYEKHVWDLARIQADAAVKAAKNETDATERVRAIATTTQNFLLKQKQGLIAQAKNYDQEALDNTEQFRSLEAAIAHTKAKEIKKTEKEKADAYKEYIKTVTRLSEEKSEVDRQSLESQKLLHAIETGSARERAAALREIGRRLNDDLNTLELERVRKRREQLLSDLVLEAQAHGDKTDRYRELNKELAEIDLEYSRLFKKYVEDRIKFEMEKERARKDFLREQMQLLGGIFRDTLDLLDETGTGHLGKIADVTMKTYEGIQKHFEDADKGFITRQEAMIRSVADGVSGLAQITMALYANAAEVRKQALERELEAFKDAREKEIEILKEVTEKKKAEYIRDRDAALEELEKVHDKELEDLDKIMDARKVKYDQDLEDLKELYDDKKEIKDREKEDELDRIEGVYEANKLRIERALEDEKVAHEQKVNDLKEWKDQEMDMIEQHYDRELKIINDRKEAAIEAIREEYEEKSRLMELYYQDAATMAGIDDAFRLDLMNRWRERRLQELAEERDRLMQLATNAEQRANVENYYNEQVALVHKQYEEGKVQDATGTRLAKEQLAFEEKETAVQMKEEQTQREKAIEQQHANEVQAIKAWLTSEKDRLESEYTAREMLLKDELRDFTRKYEDDLLKLKDDYAEERKATERRYADEIEKIMDELDAKERTMKDEMRTFTEKHEQEIKDLKSQFATEKAAIESKYSDLVTALIEGLANREKKAKDEILAKEIQVRKDMALADLRVKKAQLWVNYVMAIAQMVAINPLLGLAAGAIMFPIFKQLENKMEQAYHDAYSNINGPTIDTKPYDDQKKANTMTGRPNETKPGDQVDLGSYANITDPVDENSPEFRAWKAGKNFAPDPGMADADGHEAPIGWLKDAEGRALMNRFTKEFILVFEWIREGNTLRPRTTRKFHDGTDWVDGAGYPGHAWPGLMPNEVPAILEKEERVLDKERNRRIKGVSNAQLVDDFERFQLLKDLLPGLADLNYTQLKNGSMGSQRQDIERIVKALSDVRETVANKPVVTLNVDPYKVDVDERTYQRRVRYESLYNKSL